MNDVFAADPCACKTLAELQLLLGYFGPFAGRYLAEYPSDWRRLTERAFDTLGDVERERIKAALRRAKEAARIVERPGLRWDGGKSWYGNAVAYTRAEPPVFRGLIPDLGLGDEDAGTIAGRVLELSPTAEEFICGTADEYARVSGVLLSESRELYFIDPYLNVTKKEVREVIEALSGVAMSGKCESIKLLARYREVFRETGPRATPGDVEAALAQIFRRKPSSRGIKISYVLVRDEDRKCKMHGRYILSIKGGIRLDQGFQRLPSGRKVAVGPLGKDAFEDLVKVFIEEVNDLEVVERFSVET